MSHYRNFKLHFLIVATPLRLGLTILMDSGKNLFHDRAAHIS